MKTAMQELIETLNHVKEFNLMIPGIIKGAEKLLEREKQQIIDAYSEGYGDGVQEPNPNDEYYEQTYNQKNSL